MPDAPAIVTLVLLGTGTLSAGCGDSVGDAALQRLLMEEEHERRYQRLFLLTANLKNELYFLKKDAENIEGIMTRAYQLYEQLGAEDYPEPLRQLALSIAGTCTR